MEMIEIYSDGAWGLPAGAGSAGGPWEKMEMEMEMEMEMF